MVGARNASAAAVKLARDFAMTLAEEGLLIAEQPPRHRTTRQPFPQPQSDYSGPRSGDCCGIGRAEIRFADHRKVGGRGRA